MRIAHRNDADFEFLVATVERIAICSFVGHEWNLGWLKFGRAHADGNQPVVIHARLDRASRAEQGEGLWMPALIGENAGNAANAVATLLDLGAVVVENSITGRERGIVGCSNPHQLVEPWSGLLISEYAEFMRRRRQGRSIALVDDKNLVTRAVHFCVSNVH